MRDKIEHGTIYYIKNKSNNKYYIGQTTRQNPFDRISEHIELFENIIDIEIGILVTNVHNKTVLDMLEAYYIGIYDSYNNGYNNKIGNIGSLSSYIKNTS